MDNRATTLDLLVYIDDPGNRERCLAALKQFEADGRLASQVPWFPVKVRSFQSEKEIDEELSGRLRSTEERVTLLLSDRLSGPSLVDPNPDKHEPTGWAKGHLLEFQDRPFATISLTDRTRRIQDIDRTLRRLFEERELLEAVGLAAERLMYLRRPSPTPQRLPIVVRLIRTEAELATYFRLRHRVYRVMGYLEPRIEFNASGMEMDWCDTTALHIGAFEQDGAREELVGTARVVSVQPLDDRSEQWARNLARYDQALRSKLNTSSTLILPIFHSIKPGLLGKTYAQLLTQEPNCGELSRIIVKHSHRGAGLAFALARFAILKAIERGVSRLLLECLHLHEGLYRKLGFQTIPSAIARVPGINRTMIAMEMNPDAVSSLAREAETLQLLQLIRERGYLCPCHFNSCQRDSDDPLRRQTCPGR